MIFLSTCLYIARDRVTDGQHRTIHRANLSTGWLQVVTGTAFCGAVEGIHPVIQSEHLKNGIIQSKYTKNSVIQSKHLKIGVIQSKHLNSHMTFYQDSQHPPRALPRPRHDERVRFPRWAEPRRRSFLELIRRGCPQPVLVGDSSAF